MNPDLISKCIEKAKKGKLQIWEENGVKKFIGIYHNGDLDITYANPEEAVIVSYNKQMVFRAKNGEHNRYVPGDWENLIG